MSRQSGVPSDLERGPCNPHQNTSSYPEFWTKQSEKNVSSYLEFLGGRAGTKASSFPEHWARRSEQKYVYLEFWAKQIETNLILLSRFLGQTIRTKMRLLFSNIGPGNPEKWVLLSRTLVQGVFKKWPHGYLIWEQVIRRK